MSKPKAGSAPVEKAELWGFDSLKASADRAEARVRELEDLLLGVFEVTGHTHDWRCDSGCALSAAQWKGAAIKFAREEEEAHAILAARKEEK